jgi:crotonobetainyl-CoA:carnitine CoA-transferase CaiB-like acyl-CoA transferase
VRVLEKALEGIVVTELSYHLNGPIAGRLLAELGATVIKVEPPWGEPNRRSPPFIGGESIHFMNYNANKKFITLNLKHEEGKKLFLQLVGKSDVLIENFRPGVMERLGLGHERLREVNPSLIYASSTGYGYTGPYRDEAAYDTLIQAMTGVMDATGLEGCSPVRCGPAFLDIAAGTFCALAILAALLYRKETGLGQRVDISMFDVAVVQMIGLLSLAQGNLPVRNGNRVPVFAPYNVYRTKDGNAAVIIGDDQKWRNFLLRIGRRDLLDDPRFTSVEARLSHSDEVDEVISTWAKERTTEEIVSLVKEIGGAAGPVRSVHSLFSDPQVRAREMLIEVLHPTLGKFVTVGSALKMSVTPGRVETPGLPLGYNNEELFCGMLGLSREELRRLKAEGVV